MRVIAAASARKDIGYAGRPSSRIGSNNIDSARNTLARMPTECTERIRNSPVANCNAQRVYVTSFYVQILVRASRSSFLAKRPCKKITLDRDYSRVWCNDMQDVAIRQCVLLKVIKNLFRM